LHARHLLREWGLDGLADTAELLTSELVTNAVQAMAAQEDQSAVALRLSTDHVRVLIEVWDADPQPPVPKDPGVDDMPGPEEEGERGLFLVAALSRRWSWYLTRNPMGKVVWCELAADRAELIEGGESATQPSLPRRVPAAQLVRSAEVMSDLDILRRLRDGLRDLDWS
jgi:anti-sigma regulatory factor (Ser/Thr protein kinase)